MRQPLPLRYLFAPMVFSWWLVFMTSFIVIYGATKHLWTTLSWAAILALVLGCGGGAAFATPFFLQYTGVNVRHYESSTQGIQEPQVLVIQFYTDENEAEYIDCGMTEDEWRKVAVAIHREQKYTVDTLMNAFGSAGEQKQRGREIYSAAAETLKTALILVERGTGYALTDLGKYFFKRLATLPYPYQTRPDILKLLGKTAHTQATHIDLEAGSD